MNAIVDSIIDNFIRDYATSTVVKSLEDWGTQYGVSRWTVAKWIKEHTTDIEEIQTQTSTEFYNNLQRTRDKALKVVDEELDKKNIDTALKMMPFYTAKKEHLDVAGSVEVNQPLSIAIAKMRQETTNVSGGS